MELKQLSYAEALKTHPTEVADITAQLRKSRSKFKNASLETFTWVYDMSVRIECLSFQDVFAGKKAYDADFTLDQKVSDYMSRCSVCLVAKRVNAIYNAQIPVPAFVGEMRREHLEIIERDHAAFNALPVSEQRAQQEKAVNDVLRGGAVMIPIKVGP